MINSTKIIQRVFLSSIEKLTCLERGCSKGAHFLKNRNDRLRLRRHFSTATVEEEDSKKQERERKIQELLSEPKEVISEDAPKKNYLGMLIVCPTPIGNIRDISLRVLEVLDKADIIACEDTRIAGKLFKLLQEKRIREEVNTLQEGNDPPAEQFDDSAIFGEGDTREHPNLFQIRREKQRLKEVFQKEEFNKAIEKSKSILKDLDTFRSYHREDKDKDFQEFYDSRSKRPKDKAAYGLDDPYIEYLKEKVQENRLTKRRGLFMSLHKFNEEGRVQKLVQAMQAGFLVALISDAGTPAISDPGTLLVDACIRENITVESLPGPNAVAVALSASGFPSDKYNFAGYLSKTPYLRDLELETILNSHRTAILFESKFRLLKLLRSIESLFGSRHMVYIGIELTKVFERHLRGEVADLYEQLNQSEDFKSEAVKGEVTVIIAPRSDKWNKDLLASESSHRIKDAEAVIGHKAGDKITKEEMKKLQYVIKPDHLITILQDRLDISDKDLSELAGDILNIPKSKLRELIQDQKPKRMQAKLGLTRTDSSGKGNSK